MNMSSGDFPRQAVILAGGQGTRLRPFTLQSPKPMFAFHGKPFLYYLIRQLEEQGFNEIMLLLGYKADVITSYIAGGERWKARITIRVSPVEDETGLRLRRARELLESHFLLLYCDNYCPMDLRAVYDGFLRSRADAQIGVYTNKDGYTRNNVQVAPDNRVICYDPGRSRAGLNGVDIGYAFIKREVIDLLAENNQSFERAIYPQLIREARLSAHLSDHRYYSIGDPGRLAATEAFLRFKRSVFLDRDGVLNQKPPQGDYVQRWDQFRWLPGVIPAVGLLKAAGYLIFVVTNQAGIALGQVAPADLDDIHTRMQADLARAGAPVDAIYHCPHHWDAHCACRKPAPGLLYQAQREFHLNLRRAFLVGDSPTDLAAGRAAGCATYQVTPGCSLLDIVRNHLPTQSP